MFELAQTVSATTGQLIGLGGVLTVLYVMIQIGDRLWGCRGQNGSKEICRILKSHLELQKLRHEEIMRGLGGLRGGKD